MGKSAISAILPVLVDFEAINLPTDDLLGPTTLNIGVITGGTAANVVPDYGDSLSVVLYLLFILLPSYIPFFFCCC